MDEAPQKSDTAEPEARRGRGTLILVALASSCVTALLLAGLLFWYMVHQSAVGRQYVESEVKELIRSWDPEVFVALVPPEKRTDELRRRSKIICARFAKVGELRSLDPTSGSATVSLDTGFSLVLSGHYVVPGVFETGAASVEVVVMKQGRRWYLEQITIKSDYFIEHAI